MARHIDDLMREASGEQDPPKVDNSWRIAMRDFARELKGKV